MLFIYRNEIRYWDEGKSCRHFCPRPKAHVNLILGHQTSCLRGGGVHPDYFVKLDFEIAVDQQTRLGPVTKLLRGFRTPSEIRTGATFQLQAINLTTKPSSPDQL